MFFFSQCRDFHSERIYHVAIAVFSTVFIAAFKKKCLILFKISLYDKFHNNLSTVISRENNAKISGKDSIKFPSQINLTLFNCKYKFLLLTISPLFENKALT